MIDGSLAAHTYNSSGTNGWWNLTLNKTYNIDHINLYLQNTVNDLGVTVDVFAADGTTQIGTTYTVSEMAYMITISAAYPGAKYVKVAHPGGYLVGCEIQVWSDVVLFSIDAGTNKTIDWAQTCQLDSTAYNPAGPVSYQWSMLSGPSDAANVAPLGTATGNISYGGNNAFIDGSLSGIAYS